MPPSAEETTLTSDLERLAKAREAHAGQRLEEAATLFGQVSSNAHHLPAYWVLAAAIAAERGAFSDAVAAQERACDLHRSLHGLDSGGLLLDLAAVAIAAGLGAVALSARDRAEDAIKPFLQPGRDSLAEERAALRELDVRLARLLWDGGRYDDAIAAQVRWVSAAPEELTGLRHLRTALTARDRMVEALTIQLRIALLQAEEAAPARDMGQLLRAVSAPSAARAWFRRALALKPDDALANAGLEAAGAAGPGGPDPVVERVARALEGMAGAPNDPVWPMATARGLIASLGATPTGAVAADWKVLVRDAALASLRRVLSLRPDHAEAAGLMAAQLHDRKDDAAALAALRQALKLAPRDAMLHSRLGFELRHQEQLAEAQQSFRTALALDPDLPQAMIGLANATLAMGPDQGALALIDRARALDPAMPALQTHTVRAVALMAQHRLDEAVAEFRAALSDAPEDPASNFGLGLALLTAGRLEEGWPYYAWRWAANRSAAGWRAPSAPLCRPDPAQWAGRTVLVYAEQALGDTIQFLRYARMVAARGARVLLEVQPQVKQLAASIPDLAGVFSREDPLPPFDMMVPLMDLAWAFGTTLETVPATVPYLRGDLTLGAMFRRRLGGLPGLKVGLVWSGDPRPDMPTQAAMDARRSVTLAALAPLAEVKGAVFVSLQKGSPAAQAANPPPGMVLHDWTEELDNFTATAALMTALDLVISVDTAPAHLAGALGREVWLLNRFDTDFRWLLNRDDSPWYPTLRQFRQTQPGAWGEVIQRVAAALQERVNRSA